MEYSISPIFAQGNFRTISPRRSAVDAKRLQRNMYPCRVQKHLFERCIDGDSGRLQVPSAEKNTVLREVEEAFAWDRDLRLGQFGRIWNPAGESRDLMAYFRRVFLHYILWIRRSNWAMSARDHLAAVERSGVEFHIVVRPWRGHHLAPCRNATPPTARNATHGRNVAALTSSGLFPILPSGLVFCPGNRLPKFGRRVARLARCLSEAG